MSTSMTMNDLEPPRIIVNFSRFRAATRISRVNCAKMAKKDQDNLRMKFSALNVDFNSLHPDPVECRFKVSACGCQRGIPL